MFPDFNQHHVLNPGKLCAWHIDKHTVILHLDFLYT